MFQNTILDIISGAKKGEQYYFDGTIILTNSEILCSSVKLLSSAFTKALPMIAPLAYLQAFAKVSAVEMPKPISRGFFSWSELTRSKYSVW